MPNHRAAPIKVAVVSIRLLKEPYTVPDHSAGKKGQRTRDNSISGVGMLASAIAEAPIR